MIKSSKTAEVFPRIYALVSKIPPGRVSAYGCIAALAGLRNSRLVGWAMASVPDASDIPWHRIINRLGKISLHGPSAQIQRARLEAEGVEFDANGRVDLHRFGWTGKHHPSRSA
jgi:methylated-DNA-protein-cysteine methyltransferase-like protein